MPKLGVLIVDNDKYFLETVGDWVRKERGLQIIGEASDLPGALKLVKEKGNNARVALLDQRLIDDNDPYDFSGRSVAAELKKINSSVIIASISSGDFPGVDLEKKTFSSMKVFLQAAIGMAKK